MNKSNKNSNYYKIRYSNFLDIDSIKDFTKNNWNMPNIEKKLREACYSLEGKINTKSYNYNSVLYEIIGPYFKINKRVSVVFVHGLGGDAISAWSDEVRGSDCAWPFKLAEQAKNISIYSFGYNADPHIWLGKAMLITDRANDLLRFLERDLDKSSPIIFVGHSTGSLIVSELIRNCVRKSEEGTIIDRINALIYFNGVLESQEKIAKQYKFAQKFYNVKSREEIFALNVENASIIMREANEIAQEKTIRQFYFITNKSHNSMNKEIIEMPDNLLGSLANLLMSSKFTRNMEKIIDRFLEEKWIKDEISSNNNKHVYFFRKKTEYLDMEDYVFSMKPEHIDFVVDQLRYEVNKHIKGDKNYDIHTREGLVFSCFQDLFSDYGKFDPIRDDIGILLRDIAKEKIRNARVRGQCNESDGNVISINMGNDFWYKSMNDFGRIFQHISKNGSMDVRMLAVYWIIQKKHGDKELSVAMNCSIEKVKSLKRDFGAIFDQWPYYSSLENSTWKRLCPCRQGV